MTSLRIWHGCTVVATFSVDDHGYTATGAVGGAQNSGRPDIELDPWANLVVDHRAEYATPVSIRYEESEPPEVEEYDPWEPDTIPMNLLDIVRSRVGDRQMNAEVTREILAEVLNVYDTIQRGK